ncbi:hypothetical protein TNCV_1627051 [Trichonephila clavipes]|nr:hypothetical protein TNCV_1627051 [Trichonephila clavipes]
MKLRDREKMKLRERRDEIERERRERRKKQREERRKKQGEERKRDKEKRGKETERKREEKEERENESHLEAEGVQLATDLVYLNHGQVTRKTPEMTPHSTNFYIPTNRGSRVVKVSDRGWPCYEFEPSTTKDPPCRAAMLVKSVESSTVLPLKWRGRRGGVSSGAAHVT